MGCEGVASAVAMITEDLTGNQRLVVRGLPHGGRAACSSQACTPLPCCSRRSAGMAYWKSGAEDMGILERGRGRHSARAA